MKGFHIMIATIIQRIITTVYSETKSLAILPKWHFKDRLARLQLVVMLWPFPCFFNFW